MDALAQDLRCVLRALRRNPVFALLVVIVLALGIGANTAIFSVVNATLLRPLPAADPDRLVTIRESNPEFDWVAQVAAEANMFDWRERVSAFADVAGHAGAGEVTLTGLGDPELIRDVDVTGNFFDVLGVRAALGRTLREAETWNTEPRVVVLSDGFWTRLFGRAPDVLGRTGTASSRCLRLAGAGVVLRVLCGLAATRLMTSVLFGVVPADPLTFVVVPLLLAGVAVLASWLPARGATRVDPLTALRTD